ncbi:hypothetical protein GCM10009547_32450 [Sporichthya brevicatena]|uniref:Uncharacterized protein n=1 Tax=Sporichthya brevicatena TaxID=171442 RepID=A0ABN1H1L9_9ACTN
MHVAGVIGVVVTDEEPAHVFRLDEGEDVLEPTLAVGGLTRVDDDGLATADDHRVQGNAHRRGPFALVVVNEERLGGDAGGGETGLRQDGGDHGKPHRIRMPSWYWSTMKECQCHVKI